MSLFDPCLLPIKNALVRYGNLHICTPGVILGNAVLFAIPLLITVVCKQDEAGKLTDRYCREWIISKSSLYPHCSPEPGVSVPGCANINCEDYSIRQALISGASKQATQDVHALGYDISVAVVMIALIVGIRLVANYLAKQQQSSLTQPLISDGRRSSESSAVAAGSSQSRSGGGETHITVAPGSRGNVNGGR